MSQTKNTHSVPCANTIVCLVLTKVAITRALGNCGAKLKMKVRAV